MSELLIYLFCGLVFRGNSALRVVLPMRLPTAYSWDVGFSLDAAAAEAVQSTVILRSKDAANRHAFGLGILISISVDYYIRLHVVYIIVLSAQSNLTCSPVYECKDLFMGKDMDLINDFYKHLPSFEFSKRHSYWITLFPFGNVCLSSWENISQMFYIH